MIDIEKFFDINSYSENNMPLTSELFEKMSENYFWEKSDDFKNVEHKNVFNDVETELLEKMFAEYTDQLHVMTREWFNIGFRLGVNFALEVCGS